MKSTQWLRVVMTSLVSLSAIAGCGGEEPGPGGGTGGSGGGGTGGTGTGTPGVTKVAPIDGSNGYVVLSDADAPANTAPAPAKYTSAGCTSCHSAKGQGFSPIAPEVRHVPATFAAFVIRNGRKDSKGAQTPMVAFPAVAAMPTDPALTDAEIMEVVTWLNGAPKPTTPDGLYKDFCGNCHGPTSASGGSVGIKLEGVAAAAVDAVVRAGKGTDMASRTQYMPAFDANLLTDAELGMIKTFIGAK